MSTSFERLAGLSATLFLIAVLTPAPAILAVEREDVVFSIEYEPEAGRSVWVYGNIPELGDGLPQYGFKLEAGSCPLWQATVAIRKDMEFNYLYITRLDDVVHWANPFNRVVISDLQSGSTGPGDPRPTRKGMYYHSEWAQPVLHWRTGEEDYVATPMMPFGPGRGGDEKRWRALGLGQAEREIEFYFTDGDSGRDPETGTYATLLDAFFVQDGHVFDYAPPATLSDPRQINVFDFHSEALDQTRTYRVLLPRGYEENITKTYPVLYMHDGQNVFDMGAFGTWDADETANEMIRNGRIQEIIIVAADHGYDRTGEYAPPDDVVLGTQGYGDVYGAFLTEDLKPVIDATYRTRTGRDDTACMGSSFGGNISMYLGWDFGDTFGKVGCMSSAFWAIPNFLTRALSGPKPELRMYMDSGDEPPPGHDGAADTMLVRDYLLRQGFVLYRDLLHTVGYGHEHHEEAWAARLPGALAYLFPPDESDNPLRHEIFTGDLDHDADIDLEDHVLLADCLAGPEAPLPEPCTPDADLDGDGDADLADAATFAIRFTGQL